MTAKEYADAFAFQRLTPDKSGMYSLPMDFIRSIVFHAYLDGERQGLQDASAMILEKQLKEIRNGVSQSN